jgi:hypothetical protein
MLGYFSVVMDNPYLGEGEHFADEDGLLEHVET